MNLFEKIYNHQILTRLDDSGALMVSSHERAWLKAMLRHSAAEDAFTEETLAKLRRALESEADLDLSQHLLEKARSVEKRVYHPHLRPLRRLIMKQAGMRISYETKSGRGFEDVAGCPYRLEYSMVKREWYLIWYSRRHNSLLVTPLAKVTALREEPVEPELAERVRKKLEAELLARRHEALIEIVPVYNGELSRILYAFSSFDRKVEYDAGTDTYRVRVTLLGNEREYLLSKLRFLGKRVRVVEGQYLRKRMAETARMALERYQERADG